MLKTTADDKNQKDFFFRVQELINTHISETRSLELCKEPLVSVVIFTFNDHNFIRESLESVLAQKTNFSYEIIITDDCSSDGTTDIIRGYQSLYPDKIRLLIADRNLWNPLPEIIGLTPLAGFQATRGKYIALQHGDDYWTDPLKLQKQVDFLEANPDFAICFHNVQVLNETYPEKNYLINNKDTKRVSTLEDLLEGVNYIGTTSMMLRASAIPSPIPSWFSQLPFGDYGLSMLCASKGKIKYIDQVMAVYRINPSGIHGHLTNSPSSLVKAYEQHIKFWRIIRNSGLVNRNDCNDALFRSISYIINIAVDTSQIKVIIIYNFFLIYYFRLKYFSYFAKNLKILFSLNLWIIKLKKVKIHFDL